MPDEPDKLPERARRSRKTVEYHVEARGLPGCLLGLVTGLLLLVAFAAFLVLGAVTLTFAVWVACGVLLLALVVALFQRRS